VSKFLDNFQSNLIVLLQQEIHTHMLLRNFPLSNARPTGRDQTNNYIKALDIKQETDQLATSMVAQNNDSYDLDSSPNGVALNYRNTYMGTNLGRGKVTGVASFEGTKEATKHVALQADIVPDDDSNRTLTRREDGDTVRYTRQFSNNRSVVEHLVHDTATDTINYFLRNDKGQFIDQ
jgi:hypothetical protein